MSNLTPTINNSEIKKGLDLLGLNLSDSELNEVEIGNTISLEDRNLSEIGSVFILAEALSATHLGKKKKKIRFQDLPQGVTDSGYYAGIPIYCWKENPQVKCCIYLTFLDGKPAVQTYRCHHQ